MMTSRRCVRASAFRLLLLTSASLGLGLFGAAARAGTDTWLGTASVNWADANWTGADNPPLSGDALVFGASGSFGATLTDNLTTGASNFTIAGITFNAGAPSYTINSSSGAGFTLAGGLANSSTSLQNINDAITLSATQAFTMTAAGGNLALGGTMSGAGGITTAGAGTLTLTGPNTYTGATYVGAGTTLTAGAASVAGVSGALGLNSPVTLANSVNTTLVISGFNTQIGSLAGGGTTGGLVILGTNTLTIAGNNINTVYTGDISSSGTSQTSLIVNIGSGALELNGSNAFTGGVVNQAGTLNIASLNALGNAANPAALSLGMTSGTSSATLEFSGNIGTTYSSPIKTVAGSSGTFTVWDTSGKDTLSGSISLANNITFSNNNNNAGTSLTISGPISGSGNITLFGYGKGSPINLTNSVNPVGTIANTGSNASGIATISGNIGANVTSVTENSVAPLVLSGINSYTGGATLTAGTIQLGSATALGAAAGVLTINGGALDSIAPSLVIANNNPQVWNGSYAFLGTDNLNLGSGAVSLGTSAGTSRTVTVVASTLIVGGNIGNGATANSLITAGNGTLVLGGSNSYTGGTTLGGGVLVPAGSAALPGSITFAGGTLQYSSSNLSDYSANIVNSTSAISINTNGQNITFNSPLAGSNTGGLTVLGNGSLTLNAASSGGGPTSVTGGVLTLNFNAAGAPASNMLAAASPLTLAGGALNIAGAASGTSTQTLASLAINPGLNTISLANNGATSTNLTFANGTIIRNAPGATLNFVAPVGSSVTLSANDSNPFLGPWAFYNGASYAATGATGVVQAAALATQSTAGVNGFLSANANYLYTSPGAVDTQTIAAATANTVTFATGSPQTISVPIGDTLALNGLLNSGAALTISGAGLLSSGSNNELVIGGTSNVNIAVQITNVNNGNTPSTLTACDTAAVTLTGVNNYTGLTTVGAGTLQVGNGTTDGALSISSSASIASGATLLYSFNSAGFSSGVAPVWGNISGAGTLAVESAKTDDETMATSLALPSGFSGTLLMNSGRLVTTASASCLGNANAVIVQPGAQLGMWLGGTFPQNFTIGGTGCADGGYLVALRMGNNGINTTIAGNVTLSANASIGAAAGGFGTIAGVISGSNTANLTVGGGSHIDGTIILSAANTFTGSTTLLTGNVLDLANNAALQNSTFVAGFAGSTGTLAFSPPGTGNAFLLGGLSGSGNIALATSGAAPGAVALNVGNNGQSTTYSGVLSDSGLGGSLTVVGGGLTLSGGNTYSGATTITAGTLQVGGGGSGASIGSTSSLLDNGSLVFNHGDAVTFAPVISGSGSLAQTGSGVLTLPASEAYSGATTISGGTLQLGTGVSGHDGTLATSGISDNGTLAYNLFGNQTVAYSISGSGGLANLGAGMLTLSGSNSYSGATTVTAGTLQLANAAALTSTGNLTVNGGLLDVHGNSIGAAAFSGLAAGTVDNLAASSTATLTLGYGNASGTFAGRILSSAGVINLVTTGLGTVELTGNNLYTGTTTVNGGLLLVTGSNTGGGAYTINGGTLGGLGTITAAVTLNAGSGLAPGAAGPTGLMTLGALSVAGSNNTIGFELTSTPASASNDEVAVKGDLTIAGRTAIAVTDLGTALGTGSYPLFTYNTGASPAFNPSELFLASSASVLTSRQTANFSASNGTVYLNIVGTAQTLTWNGSGSNTWDNGAANYTWINSSHNADIFVVGDNVIFSNSGSRTNASLQTNVNVNAAVAPGTVLVTGSNNYTFSGSGSIGGPSTSLTMQGTGLLTVATTGNSYGGGTMVQNGTLALGAANALPTAGAVSLGSAGKSGTLDLAGFNQQISGLSAGSGAAPSAQIVGNSGANMSTLTVSGGTSTFGGVIQDTLGYGSSQVALWVTGNASLTLTGPNTFTGASTINSGSLLQIGSGASGEQIASPTIVDSGTLAFNHADSLTYPGAVSGSGSLLKLGSGLLILNGAGNTYSGGTTISAGTLQIGDGMGNDGSIVGNVLDNASLQFATLGVFTYGNIVSGSGSLAEAGNGTLIVTGSNTYTGPTTIMAGTLQLGAGGSGGSIGGSSGVLNNGSLVFYQSGDVTFAPAISGSGSVTQMGANVVTLTASSTYSGPTVINGGTLQLGTGASGHDGSLATSGITNYSTLVYNLFGNQTAAYGISGGGNLVKVGPGAISLAASNTFSGPTTISGGSLVLANALAVQNSTVTVGVNNGLGFASGVTSPTVGALSGSGNISLADAAGNPVILSVGANGANSAYQGVLSGGGGLTKTGAGTFIVAGNNTYAGPTVVNQGTLQLSAGVISSFNGGEGWTQEGSASVAGNSATLTNNSTYQSGAVFYNTPVPTGSFTASFIYQAAGAIAADGATFVLQNSSSGASALGGDGSGLGYAGITPSAAVQFNLYHGASGGTGSVYTTGGSITNNIPTGAVNLLSGDPIQVTLSYNGSNLVETLQDMLIPADAWTTTYGNVNLAAVTGGGTAYLGFTGGSGLSTATQTVSNVSFVSNSSVNPLPVSTALTVAAGATFDLNGGSQSVASLTGSGTVTNTNPGTIASLTVSNGGIFSGTIQDGVDPYGNDIPLSLTVSGGALTLTGTNTYEGGTIVSGGTLTLGNNDAIAEGSSLTVGDASLFSDLSPASAVTAQASPVTAERMSPTSVPEPGTLALLAAAIVFGVWLGHRAQLRP